MKWSLQTIYKIKEIWSYLEFALFFGPIYCIQRHFVLALLPAVLSAQDFCWVLLWPSLLAYSAALHIIVQEVCIVKSKSWAPNVLVFDLKLLQRWCLHAWYNVGLLELSLGNRSSFARIWLKDEAALTKSCAILASELLSEVNMFLCHYCSKSLLSFLLEHLRSRCLVFIFPSQ